MQHAGVLCFAVNSQKITTFKELLILLQLHKKNSFIINHNDRLKSVLYNRKLFSLQDSTNFCLIFCYYKLKFLRCRFLALAFSLRQSHDFLALVVVIVQLIQFCRYKSSYKFPVLQTPINLTVLFKLRKMMSKKLKEQPNILLNCFHNRNERLAANRQFE